MDRIYLDYAATTPVDPRVFKAMRPYFSKRFGNPGSVHMIGQEAISAVDEAREKIAKAVDAGFREIIFTASASEANNLALRGLTRMKISENQRAVREYPRPRLIVSAIEHESILETAKDLEKDGVEVIYLPVNKDGFVDLMKLKGALNERTVLVSVMYANNEVGTIQPIVEISKIISDFKKILMASGYSLVANHYPLFHTDASQALQYLNCDVNVLGVDLMTLSSHKIYGPKGAGALFVRSGLRHATSDMGRSSALSYGPKLATSHYPLTTILSGGGQEYGLRSGTENVPAIVGFGKAAKLLREYDSEAKRVGELRDYFWSRLKKMRPGLEINGPKLRSYPPSLKLRRASKLRATSDMEIKRLPNNLSVYFPDSLAEELLIKLDMLGIEVSAGPACAARSLTASYVIKALGFSEKRAKSSIRFSLGRYTTKLELDTVLTQLKKAL